MNQHDATDIFTEIATIYDAQVTAALQIVTDHQKSLARQTVVTAFSYLAPPPDITTADWMDQHVHLSASMTATPGRWHTDKRPFLRGIADAFDEPGIETVTVEKASRMGITMLLNGKIGKHAHLDPCAMMYVQQTLGEAKKYSSKIFKPFVMSTKVLHDIFTPEKTYVQYRTLNGHLLIVDAEDGEIHIEFGHDRRFNKFLIDNKKE